MGMFFLFSGFILLNSHFTSAIKIKNITLYTDELVVKSPSRLFIPCRFYADEQVGTNHFLLEWGLTPENSDNYTPILRLYDTILEYMENGNSRAQVFVYLVPEGNCSLVINPTYTNDSGTYEIRLTINGVQHSPVPVIKVKVLGDKTVSLPEEIQSVKEEEGEKENTINEAESSEEKEAEEVVSVPLHATTEGGDSEGNSESFDCNSFEPQILLYAQILQKLEREHKLKLLTYGVIVFGILLSVGSSIGVVVGILYCKKRNEGSKKGERSADVEAFPPPPVEVFRPMRAPLFDDETPSPPPVSITETLPPPPE
ncbi:uncharacterized protein LOC134610965 isoform X2 [Pelobates fuscus]|uniref:uncharacterized protein LOC134610965 isoform X2 n=1 Tax=Pelobates fuscus TaxID=191477 RepID=UPI002FE4EDC8